jgi:hypothetical protein
MRTVYNYYLVVKDCWIIIGFLILGYFALVLFAQGQDILKEMSLHKGSPDVIRQSWLMFLAVGWWSWQSFRSARIQLHLTYFNFWNWTPEYALGSQVLVPRVLAIFPFLIVSWALYKAKHGFDPQIALYLSAAIWFYVFLHFRRRLIVWLKSKKGIFHRFIPDYIPIKNGSYPVKFVLQKQSFWIWFRGAMALMTFTLIILLPIRTSLFVGSAGIILWAFGTWLVILGFLTLVGKLVRLPVFITLIFWAILFSFFNNNHDIRMLQRLEDQRPDLESYFLQWYKSGQGIDTVYLIASEGGGIRSAYWSASVLTRTMQMDPKFKDKVFCMSGVSGGSLGSAISAGLMYGNVDSQMIHKLSGQMLGRDFLSPVTAWMVFPDVLQKFIPFPVPSFDRVRALEKSWEKSWDDYAHVHRLKGYMSDGFIDAFDLNKKRMPVVILNATLAEEGSRVFITNIKTADRVFFDGLDFFDISKRDIPLSTAVGISARFPFITAPAALKTPDGTLYGNLLDGGYYENTGATTILEVYHQLRDMADRDHMPVVFKVVLLKNVMPVEREGPIRGLTEIMAPLTAFTNIWYKSGAFELMSAEKNLLRKQDCIFSVNLERNKDENLPLGWYLSENARKSIDKQVERAAQKMLFFHPMQDKTD